MATPIVAEVWGSPISHSKSPDLHQACYTHLGLSGSYARREVTAEGLPDAFATAQETLTGISLTMPLKEAVLGLVPDHRGFVDALHAANTAVLGPDGWWLANTDPTGAAAMFRKLLDDHGSPVWLLGAGATARAVVAGLHEIGFQGRLTIAVRSPQRALSTLQLAHTLDVDASVTGLYALNPSTKPHLIVSTLPSGTPLDHTVIATLVGTGATLMDVGYHPWPTPLAQGFLDAGHPAQSGLPMLMFQALAQVRCFAQGDAKRSLPDEAGALAAMADAVGIDPEWANPALMGQ